MHFSSTLVVALATAAMAAPSALDIRQAKSFSCTATVRQANTLLTSFQAFDENGQLFSGKELPKSEGECDDFLTRLQGIAEENGLADRPPFLVNGIGKRQAQSFSCTATVRQANTLLTSFQAFDENGQVFSGRELPKSEGECDDFLTRLQGIAQENGLADRPPFFVNGIGKRQAKSFSCTATVRQANTLLTSFQAFDGNGKPFSGKDLPKSEGECDEFLTRLQGIAEENGLADRPPFFINGLGKI